MPAARAPKKRILAETSSARTNIAAAAVTSNSKKQKTDHFSSSPAPRFHSSQAPKVASSQVKSTFETDVLEKISQGISDAKNNNTEKDQSWARPPVADGFSATTHSLCFQQIEAEEGTLHGGSPTIKLFGVTDEGNSVMLHVKDFKHYLYVAAPTNFSPQDCMPFRAYLESQVGVGQQGREVIHAVVMAMRESIYGFQNNTQSPFLKITVTDPKFINKVRTTIQSCNANWKGMWKSDGQILTFDNIQYIIRFMVDNKVSASLHYLHGILLTPSRSSACPGSRLKPVHTNSSPRTKDNRIVRSKPNAATATSSHTSRSENGQRWHP